MDTAAHLQQLFGLSRVNLKVDLPKPELMLAAVECDRGRVAAGGPRDAQKSFLTELGTDGPLVYYTDPSATGRRTKDTFIAAYPELEDTVWWKDDVQRYDPDKYEALLKRVCSWLDEREETLFVRNVFVGSDPAYAAPFTFVGQYATHACFVDNMFPHAVPGLEEAAGGAEALENRRWTLLNVPEFHTDPERDGSRSEAAIITDFRRRIALVVGPADYCGSNKKTIFTVLNYMLPEKGWLPMHCSANVGERGDVAIMFGLSGTGKTTLSADPDRQLIGDDEHAWTENGISNFEGGCYAKLIDLDKEAEPVIAAALSMAGTTIENVPPLKGQPLSETDPQALDLSDSSITENTRFSYPLSCNPNVAEGSRGGHPETVVLLTADAFGVLPPVSVLDAEQVMYHFVSGFTSKLAGTEVGITEPKATFSACFGAPFMSRKAGVYAKLLAELMQKHEARCILLNTGWSGGAYGVGKRMKLSITRALLNAALQGELDSGKVDFITHPVFNLKVPVSCPGVPAEILDPRNTWEDKAAYDAAAQKLRDMFAANFQKNDFGALGIKEVM